VPVVKEEPTDTDPSLQMPAVRFDGLAAKVQNLRESMGSLQTATAAVEAFAVYIMVFV